MTGDSPVAYLVSYQPNESERLERPTGSTVSSNTSGADLAHIPLGSSVSRVGTAENGFYKGIDNGRRGYALRSI